jgi:hypothetical protein
MPVFWVDWPGTSWLANVVISPSRLPAVLSTAMVTMSSKPAASPSITVHRLAVVADHLGSLNQHGAPGYNPAA